MFPIPKSTEKQFYNGFFRACGAFCSVQNVLNHAIICTTQLTQPGASSFDGLGDGLAAAGDGILDPGADFFIVAQNFDSYGKRQSIDTTPDRHNRSSNPTMESATTLGRLTRLLYKGHRRAGQC